MSSKTMGEIEGKFADIIWENAPLHSGELVILAEKALNWKKSTTYTALKRLIERGIFKNEKSMVTAVLTREEYFTKQGEMVLDAGFSGSLPKFMTAFASQKKLSEAELKEMEEMIHKYRKG